jgi:uncharacterized protein Usg
MHESWMKVSTGWLRNMINISISKSKWPAFISIWDEKSHYTNSLSLYFKSLLSGLIATDGVDLPFVAILVHHKVYYIMCDHARIEFIWWVYGQDENFSLEKAFINTEIERLQGVQEVIILIYFRVLHINDIDIINRVRWYMNRNLFG